MDKIIAIFKKELQSYFYSPIAYIIMVAFLTATGLLFYFLVIPSGIASLRIIFDNFIFSIVLIIYIPAITMRSFSEERRTGTLEFLLTRPLTDMDLVLGKYLSALSLVIITLIPTVIYAISFAFMGPIDFGHIIGTYLGIFILSAFYISIGIFISSTTQHMVVAFILSFMVIFALFIVGKLLFVLPPSPLVSIIEYISTDYHFNTISKGVIDSRTLTYYFSGIVLFLLMTKTSLESRKWN